MTALSRRLNRSILSTVSMSASMSAALIALSATTALADSGPPGIGLTPGTLTPGMMMRLGPAGQLMLNSMRVHQGILTRATTLTPAQMAHANQLLQQLGQVVAVTTTVPRPLISCVSDDPSLMAATFAKVKDFAYSGSGLNYSSSDATAYAQWWVQKYPCGSATGYIADGKRLKDYAYGGRGLNLSSGDAATYTRAKLETRCLPNVDYVGESKKHYDFAYSGSGLNMSSRDASEYTRAKMEAQFLSCHGLID